MARNDGIDRTFARNQDLPTLDDVAKVQEHNEREKDSYSNQDKIGNTWYVIETECDGNEPLADKVKRLIFSDKGVIC